MRAARTNDGAAYKKDPKGRTNESRRGTIDNSQGRKPLERVLHVSKSRGAAAEMTSAPPGLPLELVISIPGASAPGY